MKPFSCVPALLLLLVASVFMGIVDASALAAERITLARNGEALCAITVGINASPTEKSAASELASYLKRVTGAEFEVVIPVLAKGRPVIAVGPEAAEDLMPTLDLDRKSLGDDGIVIKTSAPNLILTGADGSRRGTIYAVYQFLEDYVGVRWWTSSENFVPSKPNLEVDPINKRYVPPLAYRDILYKDMLGGGGSGNQLSPAAGRMRFAVQMKLNGHFSGIPSDWGGQYNVVGWCHQAFELMPPAKYFKDHSDWYSQIDGRRVWKDAQLCCTNDEMIAELTKNVLALVRQYPDAKIIDVSQNDCGGNCKCANCRKIDEAEGSPSGSILYCINKVAEAVGKVDPEYMVEFISYQYSRKPPKTIRPRNNVIVRFCVIERSCTQPIDSKANAPLLADLNSWRAIAPKLMLWDYTDQLSCSLMPHPNVNVLASDFHTYVENNVKGVFCEGDDYTIPIGDDEMKHYVMAHALWNPSASTSKLIGEFVNGYYGPAGPMIRKYVDIQIAASATARTTWHAYTKSPKGVDAYWMSLSDMNKITRLFDQAQQKVANDPVLLGRVKRMRLQVDNQWLAGYVRYKREAKVGRIEFLGPSDPLAALDQLVADAKSFGVDGLEWAGPLTLDQYAVKFRPFFAVFSSLQKPSVPLPEPFDKLPEKNVIEVQEHEFDLHDVDRGDASWVDDPLASNGRAAFLNPKFANWAVQLSNPEKWGVKGKWRAYAIARVEKNADKGVAFVGGVYNNSAHKSDGDICIQLDPADKPAKVDLVLEAGPLSGSNVDVRDGKYHVFDWGVHDFSKANLYIWFGTTGGVTPENVKGIYIDRVFFVKER